MSRWRSFRTPLPTHTHAHAHAQCHTHTHAHAHTHARTHTHTHTHTIMHTHTHNYAQAGSAWKGVCVRAHNSYCVRELVRRRELLRERNRKGKQEKVRDRDRDRSTDHKLVRGAYTHTWVIEFNLCCFYFFVRNGPVALLEALLCARIVICRWAVKSVTCRWLV